MYSRYALCREMLKTAEIIRSFDQERIRPFADRVRDKKKFFLTGEGSSRIFPAKRAIYESLSIGYPLTIVTEGATQALEYKLDDFAVFGATNSGKTKEVVRLLTRLKAAGHPALYGLTANRGVPVAGLCAAAHVLACGPEKAVAATMSVAEQALFYQVLFSFLRGSALGDLAAAAQDVETALTMPIEAALVEKISRAGTIYFGGRNNGVAEELTLKTNEITRKKSDFLEGTYAVHGIEEVMDPRDVLIMIDPFEEEESKVAETITGGVGMTVIAVADRETTFPTLRIPSGGPYKNYVELAAGWNLLVEIGLKLGIDLDKPVRARKVGNEFAG
jgi:glucosamine--fructose-6-phosphate aminotransferase (isomerizing)